MGKISELEPQKQWFAAQDLRGVGGLPDAVQALKRKATREDWPSRPRSGRGGGREYPLSALPPAAQAALLLRQQRQQQSPSPEGKNKPLSLSLSPQGRGDKEGGEGASPLDREELWEAYGRKTNSQRAVADKRLAALDTVVALVASGVGKSRAIEQVAEETGINRATLYRWYERVRAHHRTEWAALLLPRHTGNRTSAECSPEAWDYFKADYLSLEQPASTACYSRLKALAAERGWTTPSLATLQRRIRSEIAPQTRVLLRQGEHALMRLYPSLERSVGELHALEWINGDGYRHNVFVRWPDGTIARPVTWLWQDIYSRKILAWRTDHTENSDLIRLALADLIEHWGVPEHATLDNTRAAANKWLSGGTPTRYRFKVRPEDPLGILPRLGIQVHWTSVQAGKGWGQAKPIERAFGVGGLSEYIDKDPAFRGAWTGPDPTAKPENYNSRAVDLQTFEAVLADRLAVWNSQPGRRTEICQGRLSFDEAFSASYSRSTIRKASSAQRRLLLLAAESVRVDNTGAVALDFGVGQAGRGGRNRYADEALLAYSDSGQEADGILGVITWRQGVLRAGEGRGATAKDKAFTKFLGLLVCLGNKHADQVAEVFGTSLIPMIGRNISIEIP